MKEQKIQLTLQDFEGLESLDAVIELMRKTAKAKFDEAVDCAIRMTPKKKKNNTIVRGTFVLPHSVIKQKPKIAVFASGEDVERAYKAGASFAGLEDLIAEILEGKIQYDYYVSTKSLVGQIARTAKHLKGLSPNLKLGTVTDDIEGICSKLLNGVVQYREDKDRIVHSKIGYKSFDNQKIKQNLEEFIKYIYSSHNNNQPILDFFKSVYISSTMGQGIPINHKILVNIIKNENK